MSSFHLHSKKDVNCAACRFYEGRMCCRYPTAIKKRGDQFCGEWRASDRVAIHRGPPLETKGKG